MEPPIDPSKNLLTQTEKDSTIKVPERPSEKIDEPAMPFEKATEKNGEGEPSEKAVEDELAEKENPENMISDLVPYKGSFIRQDVGYTV